MFSALTLELNFMAMWWSELMKAVAVAGIQLAVQASPLPSTQSSVIVPSEKVAATVTNSATSTGTISATPLNPCAQISQIFSNATHFYPKVHAELAWKCLKDVPFDSDSALLWLQSIRPYIDWQSTTAYLKDPPPGYVQPAYDVLTEFDRISTQAAASHYVSEYDFEWDLYLLFQQAHDGHFRYVPIMAGGIFSFGRPIPMISYSADGSEAPKPYVLSEVLSYLVNGTSEPSAVTQINDQDAIQYLQDFSKYGSLQDPDALYNNMFYSLAQTSLGDSGTGAGMFAGGGRGAYVYPGATTTLTFENGTITTYDNFAIVLKDFRNINSGSDLYRDVVNPHSTTKSSLNPSASPIVDASRLPVSSTSVTGHLSMPTSDVGQAAATPKTVYPRVGYPEPITNIKTYNYVAGFYLDEPGQEDVAVLSVNSFVDTPDFQDIVYDFLDQATKTGKTKLIIDLSANGGGTIMQGYNLFLNLFPDMLPYGATRFRYHEAFNLIGETVSERIWYYPFDLVNIPNPAWAEFAGGSPFNYRADVNINYQNFNSWRDKAPPTDFMGDQFSSIIRWNLSDPTIEDVNSIEPNGFGNRTGMPPTRPFESENIVLLYDGYCASTCALFSEFMTQQGGVKSVSIGGRPNEERMMQTIGGTKGANNYPWYSIQRLVEDTYMLAPDQAGFFNESALYKYVDPETRYIPDKRCVGTGSVNARDGIREGDSTQTPLQFVSDAADCQLYYTAEMTVDVSAIWEKVADVAWKGDSCIAGEISSSIKPKRTWGDGEDETETKAQAKAKAARRLQKRRGQMTSAKLNAIKESLDIVTDPWHIEPMPGLMLP